MFDYKKYEEDCDYILSLCPAENQRIKTDRLDIMFGPRGYGGTSPDAYRSSFTGTLDGKEIYGYLTEGYPWSVSFFHK